MATSEFRLPDPGEGLVEAEIVTWRVAVGDVVKVNDILVEIETAKSLVELPSPFAGTVTALLVDEGQLVDVGAPIVAISDGADEPVPSPAVALGSDRVAEVPEAARRPGRRRSRGQPRRLRPAQHRGPATSAQGRAGARGSRGGARGPRAGARAGCGRRRCRPRRP